MEEIIFSPKVVIKRQKDLLTEPAEENATYHRVLVFTKHQVRVSSRLLYPLSGLAGLNWDFFLKFHLTCLNANTLNTF